MYSGSLSGVWVYPQARASPALAACSVKLSVVSESGGGGGGGSVMGTDEPPPPPPQPPTRTDPARQMAPQTKKADPRGVGLWTSRKLSPI